MPSWTIRPVADASLETPAAPSHAYLGGVVPGLGTPNSVLLYFVSSFVSLSLLPIVPMMSPWRSCSWRVMLVGVWMAARVPSIPGISRVQVFPDSSLVHEGADPGAS